MILLPRVYTLYQGVAAHGAEVRRVRVGLIGGTGFVGSYLVDELVARGHRPRLLVRRGSEHKVEHAQEVETVTGTVEDAEAVRSTLTGTEAVIYNIGLLREFPRRGISFQAMHVDGPRRVADTAGELGVRRIILMSANGVRPDGTPYQRTKFEAEQSLRATDLDWTVFRPSVIFGPPRGRMEFCTQLLEQMVRPPLPAPLFFKGLDIARAGAFPMDPVYVGDVARAFVKALDMPETVGQVYTLCGPQRRSWKEIIQTIAGAVGRDKWMVPVPVLPLRAAAAVLDRVEAFPITGEQLTMLLEGNVCAAGHGFGPFALEPRPFTEENLAYLREGSA